MNLEAIRWGGVLRLTIWLFFQAQNTEILKPLERICSDWKCKCGKAMESF